jgi:hypothetical protein
MGDQMQSTTQNIMDRLVAANPDALTFDGMGDALVGIGGSFNSVLAIYDRSRLVILLRHGGCSESEAEEWIDYNMAGAWMGDQTPIIAEFFTRDENSV